MSALDPDCVKTTHNFATPLVTSIQRKLGLPSAVRDHEISTRPPAADSDPHFAALVASSCNDIAVV
jgi:hypothetical protein